MSTNNTSITQAETIRVENATISYVYNAFLINFLLLGELVTEGLVMTANINIYQEFIQLFTSERFTYTVSQCGVLTIASKLIVVCFRD